MQDYLATAGCHHRSLTIGYKPSSFDGNGRFYAVGISAQRLPRKVRLLLFGADHYEVDISGAHYELTRRCCATSGVHLSLPPVQTARDFLTLLSYVSKNMLNRRLAELSFRGVDFQHLPREVVRHKEDFDTICAGRDDLALYADPTYWLYGLLSFCAKSCERRQPKQEASQTLKQVRKENKKALLRR